MIIACVRCFHVATFFFLFTKDEVYVQLDKLRDQKIIQHTFNAPCGKGQEGSHSVF